MNKVSLGAQWECPDCKARNPCPDLDALLYCDSDHCRECGQVFDYAVSDVIPHVAALIERVEKLEALMKCCNKDLGHGTPYVMIRYWCNECQTEHLVDAQEMTNYIAQLHAEQKHGDNRLPDIL